MLFASKKRYYKKRLYWKQTQIWDLEFLVVKFRAIRESMRREYDRIMETLDATTQYRDLIKAFGMEKAKEINKQGPEYGKKVLLEFLEEKPPNISLTKDEQEAIDNLTKRIEEHNIDVGQFKKQMGAIDSQLEESFKAPGDGGILGRIEAETQGQNILRKEINSL